MINLIGNSLYQWDTGRQVEVTDDVTEVHFGCCIGNEALIVPVVDGKADIPNILLQRSLDIKAWCVVCSETCSRTTYEVTFDVIARNKPSDYVYTETEVKTYEALEERIETLEKNGVSEETIAQAVEDYLEENPVEGIPQSTTEDQGKVLTIDSNGDKTLEYPSVISYKYGDKMQETNNQVLFCVDTGAPMLYTFAMPNKMVNFRVYKDGEYVPEGDLATRLYYDTVTVQECDNTRIVIYGRKNNGSVTVYFFYFNTKSWSIEQGVQLADSLKYVFPSFENEIEYTPTDDYHPASKKYVDDAFVDIDTVCDEVIALQNSYIQGVKVTQEGDTLIIENGGDVNA